MTLNLNGNVSTQLTNCVLQFLLHGLHIVRDRDCL